jgi:hypothetical protein
MARSHFSFEKRRKELEKQKKKEVKREERAARKAAAGAGETQPESVVMVDAFGNVVEVEPAAGAGDDEEDDAHASPGPG